MRYGFVPLLVLFSLQVIASEPAPVFAGMPFEDCFKEDSYVSGEECYTKYKDPMYGTPEWQFIEVPLEYNLYTATKTKISYRLSRNFSPDRKTVVYFNGGPGGTSAQTDFEALDDVNVIYLNQRGAAFSRPETKEILYNKDYYSSENTARDALEIIKHLGLKKVTIYGMSYGTVPATIFGSLFPEYTNNVILEGVVYDGQSRLWAGHHRIKLLQKYFDKLDPSLKSEILTYSRHPDVFPGWFSSLAQPLMYSGDYVIGLTKALAEIFPAQQTLTGSEKEAFVLAKLNSYKFNNSGDLKDSLWFSSTLFSFIACKELNAEDLVSNFYSVFNEKNQLVPYERSSSFQSPCQKWSIAKSATYSAANYPIKVPVYYFQGTTDGATTAEYAVWHFKNSAKGRAELVLAKQQGHAVIIHELMSKHIIAEENKKYPQIVAEYEKKNALQQEMLKLFKAAMNSETLNLTKLNELIGNKKSAWVKTSK